MLTRNKILLLLLLFFPMLLIVQSCGKSPNGAIIYCKEQVFDYGKIKQGSNGEHIFTITNKGNAPLTINKVASSCSCTTISWSKDNINPKGQGQIKIKYNTNKIGEFYKTVVVKSNAVNKKNYVIKIKGEVVE